MSERILISWSGGKDSCLALAELRENPQWEVVALLTTVTAEYDRISMHGVRRSLLEAQVSALGLLLEIVFLSAGASNREYQARMEEVLRKYLHQGVRHIAFADLFLLDIRRYREEWLAPHGMVPVFPLWLRPTPEIARSFVDQGYQAVLTCVDGRALDGSFAGRRYDHTLLADLPTGVDPCGENGEFHTFVYGGPLFRESVALVGGEIVKREHWFFCDLLPAKPRGMARNAVSPDSNDVRE